MARVRRDWARLPPGGRAAGRRRSTGIPYAADLDVFGRASLFQWVGPAATAMGADGSPEWLLAPAPRDEVAAPGRRPPPRWRRSTSGASTSPRTGSRSSGARHAEVEQFLAWAEGGPFLGGRCALLRVAVVAITAAIWMLLALFAAGVTDRRSG